MGKPCAIISKDDELGFVLKSTIVSSNKCIGCSSGGIANGDRCYKLTTNTRDD